MPTLSDVQNTPLSNLNHIDALLDTGPDWNYLTPVGNVMYYTFSTSGGNEVRDGTPITGQQAFTFSQKQATRTALAYISELTGIVFSETAVGENAQVHFANIDIESANTTGLCSWNAQYSYYADTGKLSTYSADAYVYLDNNEFGAVNANLAPGTAGFETLLHELGHMLGLKHPFEDDIHLPPAQDNTAYTLMSYTEAGGPYAQFSRYDIAALNWLYGGDGLGGGLGINSVTGARFITGSLAGEQLTGTSFDDTLQGDLGDDMIFGGAGTDTAIFAGTRSAYTITELGDGSLVLSGTDGTDTVSSIEIFQFSDGTFQRSQVFGSTPAMQVGTGGNDTLNAAAGNDHIDGLAGTDTVVFGGARADYHIIKDSGGYAVTAKSGPDGRDTLLNIETLQFSNASLSVAYDDVVQALYVAYFGRAADSGGLANFQSQLAGLQAPRDFASVSEAYKTNADIRALLDSFGNSAESNALYSGDTTSFVTAIYKNVLNRDPDAGGLQFWVDAIDRAGLAKTNASLSIMAGALANTSAQGQLDAALVNNKTTIASDFTFAIDTTAELEGYKGDSAAATVRSMLSSVTANTDIAAFQATIKSVLDSLDGPGTASGTAAGIGHAVGEPAAIDAGIMLVGVLQVDELVLLA